MSPLAFSIDNEFLYGLLALIAIVAILFWIFRRRP